MKYYIETFGCQMNVHDSEKISGAMKSCGHICVSDPADADALIFNTCCIREKAEQKFFSRLGRLKKLKKKKPHIKIIVAGCIAQQSREAVLQRAPYVDYVIGPQNIHLFKDIEKIKDNPISCDENLMIAYQDYEIDRRESFKAWITIMYGCNNFCSYCVVPYTRGREASRPSQNIIAEAKRLAEEGVKEITFLGQNVNSYQSDTDFPGLLKKANEIDGIYRIRFVTSHPKDLSSDLIYAIRDLDKICEHIHLPLQSGSSRILKLMNRKYTYEDYIRKIELLRKAAPDIAITTDIIAGFPQETDKDHVETLRAIEEIGFDGMFAFKYSPRPETVAAKLDGQVAEEVKSERLNEIISLQNKITDSKNRSLKGSLQQILLESVVKEKETITIEGRTRTNKIVRCQCRVNNSKVFSPGDFIDVIIKKPGRHVLSGELKA